MFAHYYVMARNIGGVLNLADYLKTAKLPNLKPHQYFPLYGIFKGSAMQEQLCGMGCCKGMNWIVL